MERNLVGTVQAEIKRQNLLRPGDRVGVAVSGGADSVALLLSMLELRERIGIELSVVHLNHKLRGRASDKDEEFVTKLAAKHRLSLHVERMDVEGTARRAKSNLEDTARRARYEFFSRLVERGYVDKVAVAHTADDQAETVLAHILRGTGLAGLGGIHPVVGHVVRPLLGMRRAELRAYLRARKQKWREDATNRDTTRTRARVRKKLIPLLEEHFQPAVVKHLATLAELARADEAFLDALAGERLARLTERTDTGARIPVECLIPQKSTKELAGNLAERTPLDIEESRALRARLVRRIVEEVKPGSGQLNAQHVQAVLELAEHGTSGKSLQMPGGIAVRRERGALTFCTQGRIDEKPNRKAKSSGEFTHEIELSGGTTAVRVPQISCVFRFTVIDWPANRGETSQSDSVLDCDALRFPLVLRNWRPGDKLHPVGHQKTHKLKRLLNKKHVSRWERDGWPVLTSGGVLAWARGFPVAAEFAPSEKTRAGIVIAEEKLS
jgi:tRNA(Ile)-lysidine synthase